MKAWLADFPTHPATVVAALILVLLTGLVVDVRLALGFAFPDGYDTWCWVLVSLTGVAGAVGIGRRLSDMDYAAVKAGAVQPTQVNVAAPSSVTVSPETTTKQEGPS